MRHERVDHARGGTHLAGHVLVVADAAVTTPSREWLSPPPGEGAGHRCESWHCGRRGPPRRRWRGESDPPTGIVDTFDNLLSVQRDGISAKAALALDSGRDIGEVHEEYVPRSLRR
ncbi:hypothetical protein GCM10023238_22570 [Streptomyces heliomycini]